MKQIDKIQILKLLGDSSRYRILKLLITHNGNICVNDIAKDISISPSAVSHQLSKLEKLSIVSPVRKGQNVCYKLEDNVLIKKIKEIISLLD